MLGVHFLKFKRLRLLAHWAGGDALNLFKNTFLERVNERRKGRKKGGVDNQATCQQPNCHNVNGIVTLLVPANNQTVTT